MKPTFKLVFTHGRGLSLPALTDLDDYFTELIIKQISTFGKDIRAKNDIDFRSIFNNTAGRSNRILVEGSPGYGKTTLAR
jgi:hypothetical protein